jgi:two-component system OmpR family response regulator
MPGIDGLTVLERLRKAGNDFPVLVYTAMDDPGVALAAKELGATEVFRKDEDGQPSYAAIAARGRRRLTPALGDNLQPRIAILNLPSKPFFHAEEGLASISSPTGCGRCRGLEPGSSAFHQGSCRLAPGAVP